MSDLTVAITGAGGFIGHLLAQRLHFADGYEVECLVHRSGPKLARLARLPVEITVGSVLDDDALDALVSEADVVVHCAHGDREATVDGTRRTLSAAGDAGVERFVHLSTYVVHGWDPGVDRVDESAPIDPDDESYSEWKAAAEEHVWQAADRTGVDVTVLRPGIVYGPHGNWSRRPLRELRAGLMLVDGASGIANVVYVDNLIDAMVAAMDEPAAAGEAFLVADDDYPTWDEYYRRYADMLGEHPQIRTIRRDRIRRERARRTVVQSVAPLGRAARTLAGGVVDGSLGEAETKAKLKGHLGQVPWAMSIYDRLPSMVRGSIRNGLDSSGAGPGGGPSGGRVGPPDYPLPPSYLADLQTSTTRISTTKLRETLGWEQRIGYERGLELTAQWLDYEEEIDRAEH